MKWAALGLGLLALLLRAPDTTNCRPLCGGVTVGQRYCVPLMNHCPKSYLEYVK